MRGTRGDKNKHPLSYRRLTSFAIMDDRLTLDNDQRFFLSIRIMLSYCLGGLQSYQPCAQAFYLGMITQKALEFSFTGKLYLEKGQFKKGRNFLEKAIRLRPESGPAFRYLGECYAALKMTDEALAAYKKAIKQNPGDADSLSGLGYLLDVQGENIEIATIFCQQSVEISPDNGLFRHRLGQLYLKQNQLEDALKEFKRADDLGCDSTEFIEKARNLMLEA